MVGKYIILLRHCLLYTLFDKVNRDLPMDSGCAYENRNEMYQNMVTLSIVRYNTRAIFLNMH